MKELVQGKRRETRIHRRGNFLDPGEKVEPAVLSIFGSSNDDRPSSRLGVAQWIMQPENPLTARVMVNRVWARLFGVGLVETEEDFGTQGMMPSHRELLDWLAVDFRENGWSVKKLIRSVVLSSTYQQSAAVTSAKLEADPRNVLLSRGPRFRLSAEMVRDQALAVSGLLTRKIGGESVMPPQPEGVWKSTYNALKWQDSVGPNRYRRGLYTWFWRSSPYPMLPTFDAPDANGTCTRRNRSNTPLQALTLANDGAFMEFAKALSDRILKESSDYDEAKIRFAFDAVLARQPSDFEKERLLAFVAAQRKHFEGNAEAAKAAASASRPASADEAASATWTAFARVVLNLDEFITRE